MIDSHRDRAVAPNLFDAVVDPELVFTLVLANLMSPRLWELRDRLLSSTGAAPSPEGIIPSLQHMIDRHFEHVLPSQVAEMNGVLDLDAEAERLGSETIDYALAEIHAAFSWRMQRGTFPKDAFSFELVEQRKFPAYVYATIDEARAYRRFLRGRKHKPLGLTCCLDEAAIFTALNLILPNDLVEDIALIGSPAHYTVFTWSKGGTWWFYSKHELHSPATWGQLVADIYGDDAQAAFDDRLPRFDRIITISGSYIFASGEASMDEVRLANVVTGIEAFLGFRPAQLDRALTTPPRFLTATDLATTIDEIPVGAGAEAVHARLRRAAFEEDHPSAWGALHAYRSLDLPDLRVYLSAARRSIRLADTFGRLETIDDAFRAVASINGGDSIFEDANRIAMPDETARFATGTDRDKALLLHVLLEQVLAPNDPALATLETLFSDAGSFVRSAQFCFNTTQMSRVPQVEGQTLHRIADW